MSSNSVIQFSQKVIIYTQGHPFSQKVIIYTQGHPKSVKKYIYNMSLSIYYDLLTELDDL